MEFSFDINQLFSERVTVMDHSLVAEHGRSAGRPEHLAHIATVIDEMGRASAKAQQLTAPITSASKMQSQRHQLYLLKDRESHGGRGVAVGFLKVGCKKLFLLDRRGEHVEAEPLCVLDFYIAEKFQRHGYGLELFDFMLQHKNLEPVQMAYDRPSPKLQSFLAKHYGLTQSVPQVNNFVVFESFFLNRTAAQLRKTPSKKPDGEIKPYSLTERELVHQEQRVRPWPFHPPHSPQRSLSSQCSPAHSAGSSPSRVPPPRVTAVSGLGGDREQSPQSPLLERCRASRTRGNMYSRHLDSGAVEQLNGQVRGLSVMDRSPPGFTHSLDRIYSPQIRLDPSSPIPPPSTKKDEMCHRTTLEGTRTDLNTDPSACSAAVSDCSHRPVTVTQKDKNSRRETWSWTVGQNCYTAQWVKQKQEYRSTRPW